MLIGFALAFALHSFAQAKNIYRTDGKNECQFVEQGKSVFLKTATLSRSDGKYRAWASVEIERDLEDKKGDSCNVRFQLMVSESGNDFHYVKALSEKNADAVEADIVGFSPD